MKPAWDQLMTKFADHKTTVVADVDCTAAGKSLCDANGVKGYPSIKSGDPANMEDYQGGRDFDALVAHADSLKPACSPSNIDLCDEAGKKEIEGILALDDAAIADFVTKGEETLAKSESDFNAAVEELQATYKGLQTTKEETQATIKSSGLGLYKSVQAHKLKIAAGSPDGKAEL
jgi:hypothetical protein